MEMPRSRSMSIQSDTVPPRPSLPLIAPARDRTWACRARASVRVDLPASGWLMTANDRRRPAWATATGTDLRPVAARTVVRPVAGAALVVLIGLNPTGTDRDPRRVPKSRRWDGLTVTFLTQQHFGRSWLSDMSTLRDLYGGEGGTHGHNSRDRGRGSQAGLRDGARRRPHRPAGS